MHSIINKKYKWIVVVFTVIVGIYIVSPSENIKSTSKPAITSQHVSEITTEQAYQTIATSWKWQITPSHDVQPNSTSTSFTEESVYKALQHVRLDTQGNLIIDHQTLEALNSTLDDSRLNLDDESIDLLTEIITKSLPGDTGEEVATIVESYYQYLSAEKTFNSMYANELNQLAGDNIEQYQEYYQELAMLRNLYLGDEVSEKLFSTTNNNVNYMLNMMSITQSSEYTQSEKRALSDELNYIRENKNINIENWEERYQNFLREKNNILNAAIDDEQKYIQITDLMNQHFSNEELQSITHLSLNEL